jgi:hypothetical protein
MFRRLPLGDTGKEWRTGLFGLKSVSPFHCRNAVRRPLVGAPRFCYTRIVKAHIRRSGSTSFMPIRRMILIVTVLLAPQVAFGQPHFRPPDPSTMKHLTTKQTDRAPDIPGDETTLSYYQAPGGEIVTIYSFRGKKIAYSVHRNEDVQNTYRLFLDLKGNGMFEEVPRGVKWQVPAWAR